MSCGPSGGGRLLALAVGGALALCTAGSVHAMGVFSEPEGKPIETPLPDPMPAVPAPGQALEFYVSPVTTNRFAVDPASLAIDDQRAVRFLLVVTSASGVRNVTYEAIRCDGAQHRLLAIARPDGSWSVVRDPKWQALNRDDTVNRHEPELYARLCDAGVVGASTRERLVARIRATPRIMP